MRSLGTSSLAKWAALSMLAVAFLPGEVPTNSMRDHVAPMPDHAAPIPGGVPMQSIPDHPAGLVCVVRASWCAMLVPGTAGAPCSCPTLYGRTAGILR
jgi:hypothetical protein